MSVRNWMLACAVTAQWTAVAFAADTVGQAPAATNAVAVKAQTTCPVMGGAVDKNTFVDIDGKRIYVCCGGCIAKVKKDPAKYVKKLEAEGITLDKAESPKAK